MNVFPLWTTGDYSWLIKEFLSSTPSITLFLQALKFIDTFCTLLPGHQLAADCRWERPGQGLNHDPIQSNPEQIKKQSYNFLSDSLHNCGKTTITTQIKSWLWSSPCWLDSSFLQQVAHGFVNHAPRSLKMFSGFSLQPDQKNVVRRGEEATLNLFLHNWPCVCSLGWKTVFLKTKTLFLTWGRLHCCYCTVSQL